MEGQRRRRGEVWQQGDGAQRGDGRGSYQLALTIRFH